jgi:flagellar biosynthesis chaperone FliJ
VKQRPDAALQVALDQRQRVLDQDRQALAQRELAVQEHKALMSAAASRVRMVLMQIDAAQRPVAGVVLAVDLLGELERLLDWCEVQLAVHREQLEVARGQADTARGAVAVAHQQVRALELVLEARAAERAEKQRRVELRLADETAARVHSSRAVSR